MSGLPQSGQRRGTASARPQWWQRSVLSCLWKTRQALQCGQALFQLHSAQCSNRRIAAAVEKDQALLARAQFAPRSPRQRGRQRRRRAAGLGKRLMSSNRTAGQAARRFARQARRR
jgi:hypothetical protein